MFSILIGEHLFEFYSKFFVVLTVYQNIQLYIFIIAMLFMLLFFLAPGEVQNYIEKGTN